MAWTVAPAGVALPTVAAAWDRLNELLRGGRPGLASAALGPQLASTGDGSEQLCLHRSEATVDAALILRPRSLGGWTTFAAGQDDAALVADARLLESLFPALPGTARYIELPARAAAGAPSWSRQRLPRSLTPAARTRLYRNDAVAALALIARTIRGAAAGPGPALPVLGYRTIDELPPEAVGLFAAAARQNPESSPEWFANLQRTVFAADPGVRYLVAGAASAPVAALPVRLARKGPVRQIESLANYYTSLYAPLLAPGAGAAELAPLLAAASHESGRAHVMRFWPMDPDAPGYEALLTALRSNGWLPFPYFCFGNWFLDVTSAWSEYLKQRDGQLRSTLRRMGRKFAGAGGSLEIVCGPADLDSAIAAFNDVYALSWKKPEPYPQFVPGLIRWLAAKDQLRLGIARHQGRPVAAQLWMVGDGKASIFKLAYDETFAAYSPGTLLTAHLLEHAIDRDRVTEVDYLIGDDRHKQLWMSDRRERWGIVAYNPRTALGLALLLREVVGRTTRHIIRGPGAVGTTGQQTMKWTFHPIRQFEQLAPQWDELQRSGTRIPFLESPFLKPLLDEFATGGELLAFGRQGDELRAAAILTQPRPGLWQTFQPSQLPLGAWISGRNVDVASASRSLVAAIPGLKFSLGITQQDPLLDPRPEDTGGLRTMDYIDTAWVEIDQSFDSYWETRGKNLKSNTRKQHSKLQAEGVAVTLECLRQPGQVAAAIDAYGLLESSGWKGKDGTAVHPDNAQGRFYRRMLENFCALGRGRIYQYRFNGQAVAMDLCIEADDRIVILKTAYDESYKSISPSTLMRHDEFRELFADPALKRIEFYGKVMEWHSRWTDKTRRLYHLTCYRSPLFDLLHSAYKKARQRPPQEPPAP